MKNFILNHKRLSVGIILYIAVFIVSGFISPWQIRDITLSDLEIEGTGVIMDKIPIKIIYFGIYELIELLVYADSESFSANGLMFFISVCALFSYTYIIREHFLKNQFDNKAEEITIDFIYDNIFAYVSALLAYYFYNPIAEKVSGIMDGDTWIFQVAAVLLIILFIIIPSIPQVLQLLAYVFAVWGTSKILVYIDDNLKWNVVFRTIVIVLAAAVLLILINIVINFLLKGMQEALVLFFSAAFPLMADFIIGAIKLCVSLVLILGAILGIVWLVTKLS